MVSFCEINIPTKEIVTGTLTDCVVSEATVNTKSILNAICRGSSEAVTQPGVIMMFK